MAAHRYDLVVIGGGSAGLVAARTAAALGARVALVERDRIGGECLYTGCVPSKALLASAERAHAVRTAPALGIEAGAPRVDFAGVRAHIDAAIAAAGAEDTPDALRAAGVEAVAAEAVFERPGVIAAGGRTLRYRRALIATGSAPVLPGIDGLPSVDALTTDTVFSLAQLPRRMAVLGAGPSGCELSQAFARLGSEVTLFETGPSVLHGEEPEACALMAQALAADGVDVRCEAEVRRVGPTPDGIEVHAAGGRVIVDRVLVCAGRRARTAELGLERVGVSVGLGGDIECDDRMRTGARHVYAAGDVTAGPDLTHMAGYQALACVPNALFGARVRVERDWIPHVTFTAPEIARAGLTEAQARARLGTATVYHHDYTRNDRAITAGETRGFAKLVVGKRGRLVGATIAAPAAGEGVAEPARLIREGRTVGSLSQMVHAYPTFTEGPARAADEMWNRRVLTPRTRAVVRPLLALLRAIDRPS